MVTGTPNNLSICPRYPIVFMWRHQTQDVLITNQFQMQSPLQFLAIDRVGTTSGFLNFVGTLNLMSAASEEAEYVKLLPQLLKDAMAAHADEWLRWFHHHVSEHVILDPRRLLMEREHPERYYYDYSGKPI